MEPDLMDVAFHVEIGAKESNSYRRRRDSEAERSDSEIAHKQDNDAVARVLQRAPELGGSFKELQQNVLAKGTMINYTAGQRRFREFCHKEGYEADRMMEDMLIHYIGELNSRKTSYATLCQTKVALVLEEMKKGTSVAFTGRVDRYLDVSIFKKRSIVPGTGDSIGGQQYGALSCQNDSALLRQVRAEIRTRERGSHLPALQDPERGQYLGSERQRAG
jgi:hypothetical protein